MWMFVPNVMVNSSNSSWDITVWTSEVETDQHCHQSSHAATSVAKDNLFCCRFIHLFIFQSSVCITLTHGANEAGVQTATDSCKNRSSPEDTDPPRWKAVCVFLVWKNSYPPLCLHVAIWALSPVVLFLTADLEAVIKWEGLVSVPVCQLYTEGVLPLAGQLVNILVPQPVLCRHAPKALQGRRRNRNDAENPFYKSQTRDYYCHCYGLSFPRMIKSQH